MPDFHLKGIDNATADRIKEIARDKKWTINDVILHLLHHALGMTKDELGAPPVEHREIAALRGTWAADETAAFRAALEAFENLPADSVAAGGRK